MTAVSLRGDVLADRGQLLGEPQFVLLVRWVFTGRLVFLALAAPAAFLTSSATLVGGISLVLLTATSLLLSRSDRVMRYLLLHPLLASLDVALTVLLLISLDTEQPAALAVVCTALATGLLFPTRILVVLLIPLAFGAIGSPSLVAPSDGWQEWLLRLTGIPALVVGVCLIGAVVRRYAERMIEARQQVSEAVAAVGAAEERARLARDMHDSVGKSLYGISLSAKALTRVIDTDTAVAREVAGSLSEAAETAAAEARALLVTLRSGKADRPTIEVLRDVVDGWQTESGIPAVLNSVQAVDADPRVTEQMERALGEMLHNVAKHAEAGRVDVILRGDAETIELEVSDDGRGFDTTAAAGAEEDGHFGLRGLRERAASVGGTFEVESTRGEGTTYRWTARRQP
ncbi:sensor histidine kinase [Microlunatus speluncae]|uniref:sensor histidine kinase n=1 Tax=Microlunatus speluncae TaxID=2594267 RepID=UPI0012667169|nr:histidine kinase [Microlunatus speluncae]